VIRLAFVLASVSTCAVLCVCVCECCRPGWEAISNLLTGLTQVGEFKDDDDVIAKHLEQSEGDGGDCVVRDLPEGRQIVM
jgi:hypothetical protein